MKLQFNDKVYDILKWLCLIALPALSVLYSALAGVWGWPYAQEGRDHHQRRGGLCGRAHRHFHGELQQRQWRRHTGSWSPRATGPATC